MPGTRRRRPVVVGLAAFALAVSPLLAAELPVIHVATLVDGPCEELEEVIPSYRKEVLTLSEGEFDVRFEPRKPICEGRG